MRKIGITALFALLFTATVFLLTACDDADDTLVERYSEYTYGHMEIHLEPTPEPETEPETDIDIYTNPDPMELGCILAIEERNRQWQYDIRQFRDHVFNWHPKLNLTGYRNWGQMYTVIEQRNIVIGQAFDNHISALTEDVPYLTDFEIGVQLQRAAAIFEDNHFSFGGRDDGGFLFSLTQYRYPLAFRWFADGWYLYLSSEEFSIALNQRLVYINNIYVDDIFSEFTRFWSVENIYNAREWFGAIINAPLVLKALGITDGVSALYTFDGGFSIELTDAYPWDLQTDIFDELLIDSRADGEMPLFLFRERDRWEWHMFLDSGVLYIRLHQFQSDSAELFCYDVRYVLRNVNYSVNAVIIDARGNIGGSYDGYIRLFELLAEIVPPDMLFYFIDEGSLSASLMAAFKLQNLGAVIIGRPSGQMMEFYAFFGHTYSPPWQITLNYSNHVVTVPNVFVSSRRYGIEPSDDNIFRPDVMIEYTINDWINNRDPLLEYVLERIG